ncbi:hypothetical protein BDV95DRAFT_160794 [Massariosphaeria phaeospora]|uniref:Rhodopsin domain-containing protein n=1 Tax=Massariosphaeria phaeospora TaxID=100035 RepID=A0A7C8I4W7_9PLEO|nr:hypothetical protein BDV95DRAFT_160794 [Massariosphaeria phaeospora]
MTHSSRTPLQNAQIAVYFCGLIIGTFAISGRIWARHITRKRWQANDYLMVLSYMLVVVMACISLEMVFNSGLGAHRSEIEPHDYYLAARSIGLNSTVVSILMISSTNLIKMSITEFYMQLFPQLWLHRLCRIHLVALSAFTVAEIIAVLTLCTPFEHYWDRSTPGTCNDIISFWLTVGILAVFFGLTCVLLPMPIVWNLKLSRRKRARLMVLFGLGFCICGLTAIRTWVYKVMDYTDLTWGFAHGNMITIIEPALGILAGCIPIMAPCFTILSSRVQTSTKTSAPTRPGTGKGGDNARKSNPFLRLQDQVYPLTDVKCTHNERSTSGSSTEALTEGGSGGAMGGIRVQREIVVNAGYGEERER